MGFAFSWFKTCLTDRKFGVTVNNEESGMGSMEYVVLQGTI